MKKALIITYYWPPAGGPGVQRVLNIVEHLSQVGWEPLILTVKNPSAPSIDTSLLSRISKGCKVYKTKTSEPFEAYKRLTGKKVGSALPKNIALDNHASFSEKLSHWIRANLFIPDARKGWKRFLVREGMTVIKNEKPDVIFSTSPPHSLQLGAMKLAKKSGIPWVADLRDPWTEAYWETHMPKTNRSKKKNRRFEQIVLNNADHVTTVGEGIKDLIKEKTNKPVSVMYNGYREVETEPIPTEFFEIVHLGNLSAMQSCNELIEAVDHLSLREKKKVRLVFIGTLANEHKEKLERYLDINTLYIDFMPYEDMILRVRSAALLFLPKLNSSYSKGLISAKLFDYLALRRPIIAISDPSSDIRAILHETGSGRSFLPNENTEMSQHISELISILEEKGHLVFEKNPALEKYSSVSNVKTLAEIFEKTQHVSE